MKVVLIFLIFLKSGYSTKRCEKKSKFQLSMRQPATISFLVSVIICRTFAMIDYCRNHTFDEPTNMEKLHFSKENSDTEFGIFDKFKCLHCCSHGYRSIEWFKDGQPYPWPTDVSTLIIHPESGNQTICSQQTTPVDSGRYWCIGRNDTHFLRHEVLLQISGPSISMGWPKTTYRPRDQSADRGESVRFYCEAFVGTIDLPDFQSEITWERYDLNQSFIDGERVVQEAVFREEKRVLGSYLYFKQVISQDYGEYTCKVRNLGDQVVKLSAWLKEKEETSPPSFEKEKQPLWVFFFLLYLLVLIAFISTICLLRFGFLRILNNRISHQTRFMDDNGKEVLVIYHKNDKKEVLKTVSVLQKGSFYTYTPYPLQSRSQLEEEDLKAKANSYTAVLALISPSLTDGIWTCESVHRFIQGLLKHQITVACIFLQALPSSKPDSTEWQLLKDSLNKIYYVDKMNKQRFDILEFCKAKIFLSKEELCPQLADFDL